MSTEIAVDNGAPRGLALWSRLLALLSHGTGLSRSRRFAVYCVAALTMLSAIWIPVGLYVAVKPDVYMSDWTLIMPGSGAGHAVSLDSVGQASATVTSPFNSHSVDPKVNYKAVAESAPVIAAAAATVGLTANEFGKPRIKLSDQTALIDFHVLGDTAAQADAKSKALYAALQQELERLRNDEIARREQATSDMLQSFSEKLRVTQQRLLEYQSESEIVSLDHFRELALNLERVRTNLRAMEAQRAALDGQILSLENALGVSPEAAASLLMLQKDALFHQLTSEWAAASTRLAKARARWGAKHQQVIAARDDETELRHALLARARAIAPALEANTETLVALGIAEPALYSRLIELSAEKSGMDEQIDAMKRSVEDQKATLDRTTADASNLEDLMRKHQIATAVFSTALAKVDIGKSDRFSSYPMVQLLAAPTLPEAPYRLGRNLALLGGAAGSVLFLFGLVLLWFRKPYLQNLLKNA